jgi:ankyrin repeat protein
MNPKLEYALNLPQNVSAALHRGTNIFMNPATVGELIRAIGNKKSIERITKLIDKATNLNVIIDSTKYGKVSPLMAAIYENNYGIVELLINKGADVNYENKNGKTPLLAAIDNSNREKHEKEKGKENNYEVSCDIVKLLIDKGANVSALNKDGINPIEHAIYGNNYEIMDLLFEKGVKINDKNGSGNTPLHLAVYRNNLAMVNFLIGKGADINEINAKNLTPLLVVKDKLDYRRYHTDDENITTEAIFEVLERKEEKSE